MPHGDSFDGLFKNADLALEMALSRGGDQAVVKKGSIASFTSSMPLPKSLTTISTVRSSSNTRHSICIIPSSFLS